MLIPFNRLSPMGNRGMHEKHQVTEEPCEVKISSTVLEARRSGDTPTLANRPGLFCGAGS
jgi:hypothetical protein